MSTEVHEDSAYSVYFERLFWDGTQKQEGGDPQKPRFLGAGDEDLPT